MRQVMVSTAVITALRLWLDEAERLGADVTAERRYGTELRATLEKLGIRPGERDGPGPYGRAGQARVG